MLTSADEIIQTMKNQIDTLVAGDEKIQNYLIWLHQKTNSVSIGYKTAAVRAFYLVCALPFAYTPNCRLEGDFLEHLTVNSELAVDQLLFNIIHCTNDLEVAFEHHLSDSHFVNHARVLSINFEEAIDLVWNVNLKQEMKQLKQQLPSTEGNFHNFYAWWQNNSKNWVHQLKDSLINHRNIGYDWQFNQQQIELLYKYFYANKLLMNCLNVAANIHSGLKQKIEDDLFLAIAEIKP
jgi:hypothetical protein